MADDRSKDLSLDEVKRQFVDAEDTLRNLKVSIQGLSDASRDLNDSKAAIDKTTGALQEYAGSLTSLTGKLAIAIDALQKADPAAVATRLSTLEGNCDQLTQRLATVQVEGQAAVAKLAELGEATQTQVSSKTEKLLGLQAEIRAEHDAALTHLARLLANHWKVLWVVVVLCALIFVLMMLSKMS